MICERCEEAEGRRSRLGDQPTERYVGRRQLATRGNGDGSKSRARGRERSAGKRFDSMALRGAAILFSMLNKRPETNPVRQCGASNAPAHLCRLVQKKVVSCPNDSLALGAASGHKPQLFRIPLQLKLMLRPLQRGF